MTTVTNIDGTYVAHNPHDHCRHGAYVGGCGIDFMCHACEMGDPDPTMADLRREFERAIDDLIELWQLCHTSYDDPELAVAMFGAHLHGPVGRTPGNAIRRISDQMDWVRTIADHDEDDAYLAREHRRACDRWHRQVVAFGLGLGYQRVWAGTGWARTSQVDDHRPSQPTIHDMTRMYERES